MKNKLLMLIICGIFTILSLNIVFSYSCYQESTNESSVLDGVTCSLNYSGISYDPNTGFDWWYGSKNNVIDGNSSSYGYTDAGGGATMILNYTKPSKLLNENNTIWQIKDGTNTTNLTISDDCMNYALSFISLKVVLRNVDIFGDDVYYWGEWSCMNGTGTYRILLDRTAYNKIYEDAIIWDINETYHEVEMNNLIVNINETNLFNYTANYSYVNYNLINTYWFINNTLWDVNTDYINGTNLENYVNTELKFIAEFQHQSENYENYTMNTTIYYPIDLYNQYYNIGVLNQNGTDTNFSVDMYLNVELSVNYTTQANATNEQIWYQWFLDGVSVLKGWGSNVINLFFEIEDEGVREVSVNASLSNSTDDENVWSSTKTWTINVTKPTLEPNYILTDTEVYDSIDIVCRHQYTGHVWLYDVDALVTLENGSREWVKTTSSLSSSDLIHFSLLDYQTDRNVTIRCRTYNTYFNYSNYTYSQPIWKKDINNVKLFKIFNKPMFVGQINAFETHCDMSNNNKYEILYHWIDGNADGTYDKLMQYQEGQNINKSVYLFETKYILSGIQNINTGCVIKKLTSDNWEFSYCNEEDDTCAVQKVYNFEVFN